MNKIINKRLVMGKIKRTKRLVEIWVDFHDEIDGVEHVSFGDIPLKIHAITRKNPESFTQVKKQPVEPQNDRRIHYWDDYHENF